MINDPTSLMDKREYSHSMRMFRKCTSNTVDLLTVKVS